MGLEGAGGHGFRLDLREDICFGAGVGFGLTKGDGRGVDDGVCECLSDWDILNSSGMRPGID
jgi:hypothetical protein